MGRRMRGVVPVLAAAGLGTALLAGVAGADDVQRYRVDLSGANEFNAAGAPINPHGAADHSFVKVRFHPGRQEVCWAVGPLTLTPGDARPTAGHIHKAPVGVAGPIVINFFGTSATPPAPTSYPTDFTCVPAPRALIRAIQDDPSAYYVNLHNAQHPGGVMRGQLETDSVETA